MAVAIVDGYAGGLLVFARDEVTPERIEGEPGSELEFMFVLHGARGGEAGQDQSQCSLFRVPAEPPLPVAPSPATKICGRKLRCGRADLAVVVPG